MASTKTDTDRKPASIISTLIAAMVVVGVCVWFQSCMNTYQCANACEGHAGYDAGVIDCRCRVVKP